MEINRLAEFDTALERVNKFFQENTEADRIQLADLFPSQSGWAHQALLLDESKLRENRIAIVKTRLGLQLRRTDRWRDMRKFRHGPPRNKGFRMLLTEEEYLRVKQEAKRRKMTINGFMRERMGLEP